MTEVPEYLLERSRDRRRALGLLADDGGGDGGGAVAATDGGGAAPAAASGPSTAELVAAAKAAAVAEPAPEPEPEPEWVQAARSRDRIPMWVLPVLFLLPVWGFTYVKLTEDPPDPIVALTEGATVYSSNCSSCHNGDGSGSDAGGSGRALWNGEVLLTFPDLEDGSMEAWISHGTTGTGVGTPYGDANRPGGQRISGDFGQMPGFDSLNEHQIYAVARYVREQLSGEELSAEEEAAREQHWVDLGGGAAADTGGGGH